MLSQQIKKKKSGKKALFLKKKNHSGVKNITFAT